MKKKVLAIILGGILVMTLINGCTKEKGINADEITGKFTKFINMFPSKDLTYLYDKEGIISGNDLGTWVISSYVNYKEEGAVKSYGLNLFFNRSLREARGKFYVYSSSTEKEEYLIKYDKDGVNFLEEVTDKDVREKFNKFKMLYDYISIDKEYLSELKLIDKYYNKEVPIYGLSYKLPSEDKNLNKIKEIYPELKIDKDQVKLELDGDSNPDTTMGYQELKISLDNNTSLTAKYSFNKSDFSANLFNKE